jgi:type 1 fimbriae regulatory protein FimB
VAGYQRMVARAGEAARFPFLVHSHMLRHSCGFALANMGIDTRLIQDYLGHRNIRHTVWYTARNAGRFYGIWDNSREKQRTSLFSS